MDTKDYENLYQRFEHLPDFLLPRKPPGEKEYYKLVGCTINLISNHLESIAQQALGDFSAKAKMAGSFGPLNEYQIPEKSGLPLTTRGLWFGKFHTYPPGEGYREATVDGFTGQFREETDHIWGYSRDRFWVIASILHLHERDHEGLGRSPHVQIIKVNVEPAGNPVEVTKLAGVDAHEIWVKLNPAIYEWCQKREELYLASAKIKEQLCNTASFVIQSRRSRG